MPTRRTALGLIAAAPFAGACDDDIVWTPLDPRDLSLTGAWESVATGHVVTFGHGGELVLHRLDNFWIRDSGVVPSFNLYARVGDTLLLHQYDYRATPELLQAPVVLTRAALPPAEVNGPNAQLPRAALFDLIWRTFDRFYAFFAERGVDWPAARAAYAARAAAAESDDALFEILRDMLAPLGDGHVNLSRGERSFNAGRNALRQRLTGAWRRSGSAQTEQEWVSAWSRTVRASAVDTLDPNTHRTACAGALEWGVIGGGAGYLRVNRFSNFLEGDASRPEQIAALQRALLDMERDIEATHRIIVDVGHNGGGNDSAALIVAQHFADRSRLVLEYRARNAPNQPIHLARNAGGYRRPISLVTSEVTASAAECFVLMMRAFPHVTHVGGATRGILSSLLPKPFPNGFMATIAYQHVLDDQGRSFEARGIPPVRAIELFPDEDLTGGYVRALRTLAAE